MIDLTVEIEIERDVGEVFAYVTDPATLSTWQTSTVSADQEGDGPLTLGTRLHEVHRTPKGKELASLVEVSEFEPPRRFALRIIEGPLPINAEMSFAPTAEGTKMLFRAHGKLSGPMRFAQPIVRVALKRQFRDHCNTLKRVLEAS